MVSGLMSAAVWMSAPVGQAISVNAKPAAVVPIPEVILFENEMEEKKMPS